MVRNILFSYNYLSSIYLTLKIFIKYIFLIYISCNVSDDDSNVEKSDTLKRKVVEEKRQREHILQLNQILAKQVMEKSKMVAGTSIAYMISACF